jgi:hypothetical protein
MSKSMFKKKRHMKEEIDLQITAMASVFTVILVFLLKSASNDVSPLQASSDLQLPELTSGQTLENSFKIEVTEGAVVFEDKTVATLQNYVATADELAEDGTFKTLSQVIHEAQELKSIKGDLPLITIFADKRAPQVMVQRAIASAAKNGLTKIQMVVVNDEN